MTTTGQPNDSTSTTTQTVSTADGGNSNSNSSNQQSTSKSTQTLPSTSEDSTSASTPFTFSMLTSIFEERRKNANLVTQEDNQTNQETGTYPFQYWFDNLNIVTQRLISNDDSVLDMTTTLNDKAEQQDTGDAAEQIVETTLATSVTAANFFEDSTAECLAISGQEEQLDEQFNISANMPLDLSSSSLRNEATSNNSRQLQCQQVSLNLANSSKMAGTRRRKGATVKLERMAEKEEDTDEEQMQSEKRLCQSTLPTVTSVPSTSSMAASAPSTSSVPEAAASDAAESSEKCEDVLTHNKPPVDHDRYVCLYCDIPYPDQKIYLAHMRYHDDAEPFTCVMCGKSYGNRAKFNLHIYEKTCVNH
ncbi:protein hunchback [Harpegnathos saltator]|nr:protein hunchback [Harpegnathos saltator]